MVNNQKITDRFNELEIAFRSMKLTHSRDATESWAENVDWRRWAVSAQNLIRLVYSEKAPHFVNFTSRYALCHGRDRDLNSMFGIFLSAKDDFLSGFHSDLNLEISGEIFGDFIALAKQCLSEGNKDVAIVLACASLEDALKRLAISNGLNIEGKMMMEIIGALKSAGIVGGAQKTILEAMPRIRNHAMHADWGKVTESEVGSVIGFVEQLLLTKFSS